MRPIFAVASASERRCYPHRLEVNVHGIFPAARTSSRHRDRHRQTSRPCQRRTRVSAPLTEGRWLQHSMTLTP